jgi:hypothetical protein
MISIYCIKDINDLKYVGSTEKTLSRRLSGHKADKNLDRKITSSKLDLENCEIYELETCDEMSRNEKEQYWIDRIDCVNRYNIKHDYKNYGKNYYSKNKYLKNKQNKIYREQNKEYLSNQRKKLNHYKMSWGGDMRGMECNLLKIDLSVFN